MSAQQASLFDAKPLSDICRNRHQRNQQSKDANARIQPCKRTLQLRILNHLKANGGATSKEIRDALSIPYTTVSARLSELKQSREVRATAERRDGAAVVVAN